jgi:predicted transcriptional regulator with HTH domain
MIEQLFGSKTRVKLLQLFYSNPNRAFYVREITRKIDEQINSVRRELSNLLSIGIIESDNNNNKLYYEVNQKYNFYEPLVTIFGGSKQQVTADPIVNTDTKDSLKILGRVELALYTGQFTRDDSTGIDALFVGDINGHALHKFITDLETKEGKEIRYTVMSLDDFKYRLQVKDRFINNVIDSKKQVLVDTHDLLTEK